MRWQEPRRRAVVSKYTPEPWTLQPPPIGGSAWFVWHGDQLIASVGSGDANAFLIAAAPEMAREIERLRTLDRKSVV